jgi:hypothetical protein
MEKEERIFSELPVSSILPIDGNIPVLFVVPKDVGVFIPDNSNKNFSKKKKRK